jgi:NitT/TauT family transport system substrate-binding protein
MIRKPTAHARVTSCDAKRRQTLATLASAGLLGLLGGCKQPVAPLRVGSIVFQGYELMFLARDLGLLDAREVRLVELLANTDTLRALAAGQLEAAALTLDELMLARADGVDLRAVLIFDVSTGADVVLGRAPITIETLAGSRIGFEDNATGAVMLGALLEATGLKVEQIRKVPLTLDRSEEFYKKGLVDVVVTAEPFAGRLERAGARRLFDSTAIPGRIIDLLAVRADVIDTHQNALRRLIAGHFAALEHLKTDPQGSSVRMSGRLESAPQDVIAGFRGLTLPDAASNRSMFMPGGDFDRHSQALQTNMLQNQLLRKAADLRDIADPRFLPS